VFLAEAKTECEYKKQKLNIIKSNGLKSQTTGDVSDYVSLKFEDWKKKMLCMTCRQNENEIILSCGHMSCNACIEESFNSR
jgi:hypothetical protein